MAGPRGALASSASQPRLLYTPPQSAVDMCMQTSLTECKTGARIHNGVVHVSTQRKELFSLLNSQCLSFSWECLKPHHTLILRTRQKKQQSLCDFSPKVCKHHCMGCQHNSHIITSPMQLKHTHVESAASVYACMHAYMYVCIYIICIHCKNSSVIVTKKWPWISGNKANFVKQRSNLVLLQCSIDSTNISNKMFANHFITTTIM